MSHTEQNKAESYRLTLADVQKMGKQKARVMKALGAVKYVTRRELSEQTGIEISSLCRILKDFQTKGITRIPFSVECKTTGKMVSVYTTASYVDNLLMQPEVWLAVVEGSDD